MRQIEERQYVKWREQIAACRICNGDAKVMRGNKVVECECVKQVTYEMRLFRACIPAKFLTYELQHYQYRNSPTYSAVCKYLNQPELASQKGVGLFLWGSKDTGKSFLASCVLKELMKKGYPGYFSTFSEVATMWSLNGKEGWEYKDNISTTDFLVVDNITKPLDSISTRQGNLSHEPVHYLTSCLEELCSIRSMKAKPTIVTSELSIEEYNTKFPNLADVFFPSMIEVEVSGNDFKRKKLAEGLRHEFGMDELDGNG